MLDSINKFTLGKTKAISNTYLLFGEINNEIAYSTCEWIISNNLLEDDEKPEVLDLVVNSVGGSLHDAWAIIDVINGSSIPVRTIGLGILASAGLLISMSGQKGYRIITENCSIMSHQFAAGNEGGKYHEIKSSNVEYNNIHKRLLKHIGKCTGLSSDVIESELMPPSDVWLLPAQAIKLGLADKVSNLK